MSEIFLDCLFKKEEIDADGDPTAEAVYVPAITATFGLCKSRAVGHQAEIEALLAELTDDLAEGCSFLVLALDKAGRQWGEHKNMQELVVLGCAVGALELCAPRALWAMLPGGMPYYRQANRKGPEGAKQAVGQLAGQAEQPEA
ncbi:MAG: hypothetical protein MUF34_20070 [Polyangiaceae bacterium]|nr:hypothetical protein [Polyangiaceae bacterium]